MEPFLLLYKLKKRDLSPHIYGGIRWYRVNNNMLLNRRFDTMNKDLMQLMGFDEEVKNVNKGLCPMCSNEIDMGDFIDEISRVEFKISGMCQTCQNNIFDDSFNEDDDEIELRK